MNDQQQTIDDQHQTDRDDKPRQQPQDDEEHMRQLYLQQQARLACPGCGEDPFLG